ncbi:hypothetical protein ACFO5Q_14445 [Kordiimonas lipolytica]|uniref:GlsB/YeaQ/YmgE family stress response membrane protein n=1 Tax=Kordiimonas lipolytica TaxID=1662421 RepID=A0ABV8UDU8_9PROT|nr:hypothetical protein [Kordiimonas lipolytica]
MISALLAGALTGLLAGKLLEGKSLGGTRDIALGAIGAIAAWFIVGLLGFSPINMFGSVITGFSGAMLFRFSTHPANQEEQAL